MPRPKQRRGVRIPGFVLAALLLSVLAASSVASLYWADQQIGNRGSGLLHTDRADPIDGTLWLD
jgi:hypothetical protein